MGALVVLAIWLSVVAGWVMNIIWLAKLPVIIWNGMTIVSAIGIVVFPIGAIMGWVH